MRKNTHGKHIIELVIAALTGWISYMGLRVVLRKVEKRLQAQDQNRDKGDGRVGDR
ncbi:MAG: hypothetical protein JXB60_07100 [Candidatus Cloacimonetes bacterium]|nr:hypothetical protein [Candidatus Cloacimonadota bacterium]